MTIAAPQVLFIFSSPNQFVPLSGTLARTGFCTPLMALTNTGGGAMSISGVGSNLTIGQNSYTVYPSQGSGTPPNFTPTTLTLNTGFTATIGFSVINSNGSNLAYFLSGLAVKRIGANPGGGGAVFPVLNVAVSNTGATTLSVEDDNDDAGGTSTTYDFWVLVQNAAGDIGLIDPLIVNAN